MRHTYKYTDMTEDSGAGAATPARAVKKMMTSCRHPTYKGIRSRSSKWVSEIREPRTTRRVWLGTFPSPEMAAAAYDVAALALKGAPAAALNFPEKVGVFPVPLSRSLSDIQRAAAAAAQMMRKKDDDPPAMVAAAAAAAEDPVEFVDEEALFHMPSLLAEMAEGMLLTPPIWDGHHADTSPKYFDYSTETLWNYF